MFGEPYPAPTSWCTAPGRSTRPLTTRSSHEINVGGTANVLDAMARTGTRRIVLASSSHVYGIDRGEALSEDAQLHPVSAYGLDKPRVEEMVGACGVQWVAIRSAAILGRGVDNWVRRVLSSALCSPAIPRTRRFQVVHSDDAHRVFARAAVDPGIDNGPVNLAAPGEITLGDIADALGRPTVRSSMLAKLVRQLGSPADLDLLLSAPGMDTALLQDKWNFTPAWTAQECVHETALAVRGRISIGTWSTSLPWRLTHVQDIPAVDTPAADGVAPVLAGPEEGNGEFDTPIDPRFPTYLATNLSEALPGPFTPSSASVTVKGLRASGAIIAQRLRPGGLIQREMATRTVGVFAHRLYGAITTAHYMAEVVPFVKPETVVRQSQYFGQSVAAVPIHGEQELPREPGGPLRTVRNLGVFAINLVGLTSGAAHDTRDFIDDVDRLEFLAVKDVSQRHRRAPAESDPAGARPRGRRLGVVRGFVHVVRRTQRASARAERPRHGADRRSGVGQRATVESRLSAGRGRAAGRQRCLGSWPASGDHLDELAAQAPEFHAAVLAELTLIGHRGPAEVEMRSSSYADDPELLIRMVAKSLDTLIRPETSPTPGDPAACPAGGDARRPPTSRS